MIKAIERTEADIKLGSHQSNEDLAIAALVVSPFTLTLAVYLGWLTWAPSYVLILAWVVAQILATVWNAGWRARDA